MQVFNPAMSSAATVIIRRTYLDEKLEAGLGADVWSLGVLAFASCYQIKSPVIHIKCSSEINLRHWTQREMERERDTIEVLGVESILFSKLATAETVQRELKGARVFRTFSLDNGNGATTTCVVCCVEALYSPLQPFDSYTNVEVKSRSFTCTINFPIEKPFSF